jgi:hypothetical protein
LLKSLSKRVLKRAIFWQKAGVLRAMDKEIVGLWICHFSF